MANKEIALEKIYTLTEAAEYLRVSERTVLRWIKETGDKQIPAVKIGGRWNFKESDIVAFVNRRSNTGNK